MTISVREATAADIPTAVSVLAAAFRDYSWTRWTIPAEGYFARLEELQRIYLGHALNHGLVLVDEEKRGVAAFLPPDAPEPSEVDQARIAQLLGERLDVLMATELPQRHTGSWDLATIGVRPDSWGGGVASAILVEGLRRLDLLGNSASLETSDLRNVALYSRNGFIASATTEIPNGPIVYSMHRPVG